MLVDRLDMDLLISGYRKLEYFKNIRSTRSSLRQKKYNIVVDCELKSRDLTVIESSLRQIRHRKVETPFQNMSNPPGRVEKSMTEIA